MQKKIFFKNPNGIKLCGILSNPTNDKSAPIIVLCHGFSTTKNSSGIISISDKLNSKGISTFRFDFFGHGESDGKFEYITVSEGVDDVLSAISFVKSKGYKKIGLMGSSFGGICSTLAASKSPELFVLALKSPVSDFMEVELKTIGKKNIAEWKKDKIIIYDEKRNLKLAYSFYENIKNLKLYAAALKIKIPTLIVHGDKDEIVPVQQSFKLVKVITTAKLIVVKGADHRYSKKKEFDAVVKLISDFIVKNVK